MGTLLLIGALILYCLIVVAYSLQPNNSGIMMILMGLSLVIGCLIALHYLPSGKKPNKRS